MQMKIESLSTTLFKIINCSTAGAKGTVTPNINLSSSISFDKNVTLIRGNNGAGKTVIAEALSLLGHASIIRSDSSRELGGTPFVTISLSFSDDEVKFLNLLKIYINDPCARSLIIGGYRFSFDELGDSLIRKAYEDLGDLNQVPMPDSTFRVEFWKTEEDFDLKTILASDSELVKHLRIRAFANGSEDFSIALRWLIAWNRPRLTGSRSEDGPWTQTPRYILDQSKVNLEALNGDSPYPEHPPGPVGYFNTDMYDFGAGLDIRESPKEMRSHMTKVLVDRLQLLSGIGNVEGGLISEKIVSKGQTYPIREIGAIQRKWAKLFDDPFDKDRPSQPLKIIDVKSQAQELIWGEKTTTQDFMSSGENQAFFALCYVANFQTSGSFLVFDEPELHLSIKAASTLIQDIVSIAHLNNTQVVIVTHLPHLFYQAKVSADKYKLLYLARISGGGEFCRSSRR
jgi:energy-coupling factor transporter ATP-binding protein EcfA2